MFWTSWVRGLTKVFLVIASVASLIAAIAIGGLIGEESPFLGILAFLVCMAVCMVVLISSVAFIMMLSEISVSAHEINKKLNGSSNPVTSLEEEPQTNYSMTLSEMVQQVKEQVLRTNSMTPQERQRQKNLGALKEESIAEGKYCIKCGEVLNGNARFCFKCGSSQ